MPTGVYKRKAWIKRPVIVPIGPSTAYLPLTRGMFALIDREDADWIGQSNWSATGRERSGYYAARYTQPLKRIGLHVEIVQPRTGFIADHRNGNTLDYRRVNLREATPSQNAKNARRGRANTSGFKGVTFHTPTGKWRAQISTHGKYTSLGLYRTKEEAYAAVCQARAELHGEFARVA